MRLPNTKQSHILLAAAMPVLETYAKQLGCQMVCARLDGRTDDAKGFEAQLESVMAAAAGSLGEALWGEADDCIEARFKGSNIAIRFDLKTGDFTVGFFTPDTIITGLVNS